VASRLLKIIYVSFTKEPYLLQNKKIRIQYKIRTRLPQDLVASRLLKIICLFYKRALSFTKQPYGREDILQQREVQGGEDS